MPTVYFYKKYNFGHITQFNVNKDKLGRSIVWFDIYYLIYNRYEKDPIEQSADILDEEPIIRSEEYQENILEKYKSIDESGYDGNVLVECYDNGLQHFSRNPFVSIAQGESPVRYLLTESIDRFKEIKRSVAEIVEDEDEDEIMPLSDL